MSVKGTLLGVFSESPFKAIDKHMQQSVAPVQNFGAKFSMGWRKPKSWQSEHGRKSVVSHCFYMASNQREKVHPVSSLH